MQDPDIIQAIRPVIYILEKLSIDYYISGSIASSIYGMARATLDIDIVADIKSTHIAEIKNSLENDLNISELIQNAFT